MCSEYHRHKGTITRTALGVVFAYSVAMASYVAEGSIDIRILIVFAASNVVILGAFAVLFLPK